MPAPVRNLAGQYWVLSRGHLIANSFKGARELLETTFTRENTILAVSRGVKVRVNQSRIPNFFQTSLETSSLENYLEFVVVFET